MADRQVRTACLWVADLPLAALLRAEPDLLDAPVAVTNAADRRAAVVAATPAALRQGVIVGMTAIQAESLVSGLILRPVSGAQVRSAQAALVDVACSFSPRVALESGGEVCLDLSGLGHLFASERKLAAALAAGTDRLGLAARVGIASTPFAALLAARTSDGIWVVPAGEEAAFLSPLPVSLLEASADLHAALRRFGIESLGQLAALPSRGLGRRLGAAGLRLWRLARGEDPRPLVAEQFPERFMEESDTSYPIGQAEPLLLLLQGICARLAERLNWRGLTARRLFFSLGLDPQGCDERSLDLASSSCTARTWLEVIRLDLQEHPPRAAVTSIRVEAEPAPARRDQLDLFAPAGPDPASLDDIVARLAALSGEDRVGSPRPVDSHLPDAYTLVPFGQDRGATAVVSRQAWDQQIFLRAVRPPAQVQVTQKQSRPVRLDSQRFRGRVCQLAGPWRLDGSWWDPKRLNRDYFEIELSDGGIYRLFRERETNHWFIDGICG